MKIDRFEKVKIEELYLYRKMQNSKKEDDDRPITAYEINGKFVISNGNHRVVDAYKRGDKEIEIGILKESQMKALIEKEMLSFKDWYKRENKNE